MKTKFIFTLALALACSASIGQKVNTKKIDGKEIYIPEELQKMNLNDSTSQWSYHRMKCTENTVIFWEKGFGNNVENPPKLKGHDMSVNLNLLCEKLEDFYIFFKDSLNFVKPGSKCDKYRMIVMLRYSLEGTAYGGDYDKTIGALWVTPNRLKDKKLNCIAHELGHSFQSQIICDNDGEAWGGGGFFEMASQWMLWQVNSEWQTDEQYHLDAFMRKTHKAFMHADNIYHSPYILEYWSSIHGKNIIGELFRQGKIGEDPVITYKRITGLNQEMFCDEMFDASRRMINWDYSRVWKETRKFANKFSCKLMPLDNNWFQIPADVCPENYGFNAIPLQMIANNENIELCFEGINNDEYLCSDLENEGWRYGFVTINKDGESFYSDIYSDKKGVISYNIPDRKELLHLWLVVMGAPKTHTMSLFQESNLIEIQYPYRFRLKGAIPISTTKCNM